MAVEVSNQAVELLMGDVMKLKHPPAKRKKKHIRLVIDIEQAKSRGANSWELSIKQERLDGFREGVMACTTMKLVDLQSEADHFLENLRASKINKQKEEQSGMRG
jgi:hypothetical protein